MNLYKLIIAIFVVFASTLLFADKYDAKAATFAVRKYTDTENYYITMNGSFKQGDLKRLETAYNNVNIKYGTSLYITSPGGRGDVMEKLMKFVVDKKIETIASKECYSACAVLWTQGAKRFVKNGTELGFHVSSYRGEDLEKVQRDYGYNGLQNYIQIAFKDSIEFYLKLPNIAKNGTLSLSILKEGYNASNFFMITKDNSTIIGKDITWY